MLCGAFEIAFSTLSKKLESLVEKLLASGNSGSVRLAGSSGRSTGKETAQPLRLSASAGKIRLNGRKNVRRFPELFIVSGSLLCHGDGLSLLVVIVGLYVPDEHADDEGDACDDEGFPHHQSLMRLDSACLRRTSPGTPPLVMSRNS